MATKTDLVPINFYDISYVPRMNDKGRVAPCLSYPGLRRTWDPVMPCSILSADVKEDPRRVPWWAAGSTTRRASGAA